jgi:protein-disulfide isomerase
MKTINVWVLFAGLAVGVLIGRQTGPGGGGGTPSTSGTHAGAQAVAGAGVAGEIPAGWLKEDGLKATEKMAGMTPAQRYAVLKVMNEKPCDCGCPHGSTGKCLAEDPGCPRAPKILEQSIALARQGRTYEQILAVVKKGEGAPSAAPPPAASRKVELAAWTPVKGPRNAKVTLVIFSDFQCPFCSRVEPTLKEVEQKYGNAVRIAWRNQPLPFHNHAMEAAEAAFAARAQGKFWEMHDKMFANQQKLERADLDGYARELGLDAAKFKADMDSHAWKSQIEADSRAGTSYGASGTPTMFINGRELVGAQPLAAFAAIIDEEIKHADKLLAEGTPPEALYQKILDTLPAAAPAPPPTAAAAPAPSQHVDIAVGDAPTKGPKNAPVTVAIFSDFQCPFCSRVEPTLAQLEKDYAGKIRFAWKNQPLPFHQNAGPAAEAAMAAGAQGKFWEMHDRLFANQQALDRGHYEQYAQELGLNMERFRGDLDSGKWKAKIKADSEEGSRAGAGGTPTFFINGEKLVGAQPIDSFKKVIDAELAKSKTR